MVIRLMRRCEICGLPSDEISSSIGVCVSCIRRLNDALGRVRETRSSWRRYIGLPESPPRGGSVKCSLCVNECEIPPGGLGYCGIMRNSENRLTTITGDFNVAYMHYYYDPLPTNCVAEPVCPERRHYGYYNLAVFFAGCNLDCLFCQNIEHKYMISHGKVHERTHLHSVQELVDRAMRERVACVCYFGGDPAPHAIYAIKASRKILEESSRRGTRRRICWETNGLENINIMREMARISLESGGIVKIDWKAHTPAVYEALTGINGEKAMNRIKKNVKIIKELEERREDGTPLLVVSTLVVPHYVDSVEVYNIARYLAEIDPSTPYVLLAFAPHHLMHDVPTTSKKQMESVYKAALEAGLKNVYIGNYWLLR